MAAARPDRPPVLRFLAMFAVLLSVPLALAALAQHLESPEGAGATLDMGCRDRAAAGYSGECNPTRLPSESRNNAT